MTSYFSERETGPPSRTEATIGSGAWGGIVALIQTYIGNGGFGADFPESCPDRLGTVGTDTLTMGLALRAEIPQLDWPLRVHEVPPTLAALDLLEFCYRHVAAPSEGSYHSFFDHSHLSFDRDEGQEEFRERANRILGRNNLVYAMGDDGRITRLTAPILDTALRTAVFNTGDATLDGLLETAREKFVDPDPVVRREALEQLWDAWERLKTIEAGKDKKASAAALLDKAVSEPHLRAVLEDEARSLTRIGNTFRIRHSETTQVEIGAHQQADYLFYRLFSLVWLLLGVR